MEKFLISNFTSLSSDFVIMTMSFSDFLQEVEETKSKRISKKIDKNLKFLVLIFLPLFYEL